MASRGAVASFSSMRAVLLSLLVLGAVPAAADTRTDVIAAGPALRLAPAFHDAPDLARMLPGWQGQRDAQTGVVGALWGGRWSTPGATADASAAEHGARAFVLAQAGLVAPGVTDADLVLAANVVDTKGRRTVAFQVHWQGLPVEGSTVSVVIARDAIFAAQSTVVPMARVLDTRGATRILPLVRADGTITREPVTVRIADDWEIFVGLDGRERMRRRLSQDATATLIYDVPAQYGPLMRYPFHADRAAITVDGTPTVTTPGGAFDFTGAGQVVATASGPRVNVVNAAGAPATTTLTATDGGTLTWSAATDELVDAQLSAFVHIMTSKQRARAIAPGLASWLDEPLTVTVNIPGAGCNAVASADSLSFYQSTPACQNTARVADIVYHELGHLVHRRSIIAGVGMLNGPLSEGLADFFAATLTGSSQIGRGLDYTEAPVRDIDPVGDEYVAPYDIVPNPHRSGRVISGALWDLRRALIVTHGAEEGNARTNAVFESVLARAPSITMTYLAALVGNDDDGTLANGTPDQCAIYAAFTRHGIGPDQTGRTTIRPQLLPDRIFVTVDTASGLAACVLPTVTSMELTWRRPDNSSSAVILLDGADDYWETDLRFSPLTQFSYSLRGTFSDGTWFRLPANRADPEYTRFSGGAGGDTGDVQVMHSFDTELPPEWSVRGDWEWGTARGLSFDPSGEGEFGTYVGTSLEGDGRYASSSISTLTSPPIEVDPIYTHVRLQFWRWLSVEDAQYDQATLSIGDVVLWSNATGDEGSLDHIDREWQYVDIDVTPYIGQPLQFTWSITSDDSRSLGGWNIDNVALVGYPSQPIDCMGTDCGEGCCSTSGDPVGAVMLLGWLGLLVARRRN